MFFDTADAVHLKRLQRRRVRFRNGVIRDDYRKRRCCRTTSIRNLLMDGGHGSPAQVCQLRRAAFFESVTKPVN